MDVTICVNGYDVLSTLDPIPSGCEAGEERKRKEWQNGQIRLISRFQNSIPKT